MMGYLTPNSLQGDLVCFPLFMPGHLFHYVVGALGELTLSHNWELFGTITPNEAAEYFDERLLAFVSTTCEDSLSMPSIVGLRDTDQANIPNNVDTPILWTQASATTAFFSANLTTGVITIHEPGKYVATFSAVFAANATGVRRLRATWTGQAATAQLATTPVGAMAMSHAFAFRLASAGDDIVFNVLQNSGGNLNLDLDTVTFGPARFSIVRVG